MVDLAASTHPPLPPATRRLARGTLDALKAATPRRVAVVSLLCLAWTLVDIAAWTRYFSMPLGKLLPPTLNALLSMQCNGVAVFIAVLLIDHAAPPSSRRTWTYGLAVLAGVTVGSSFLWILSQQVLGIPTYYRGSRAYEPFATFFFRHGVNGLVVCGLAAFVYVSGRRAAQRHAALRAIRLAIREAGRKIAQAQLAAMQARVDPAFLRDTLGRVEQLYEADLASADRMLQELIAYLRAATPDANEPAPSVEREVRMVNALLNIEAEASVDRILLVNRADSREAQARIPPMILLPLVRHALATAGGRADGGTLAVTSAIDGELLTIAVRASGESYAPHHAEIPAIASVRACIAAIHGPAASLALAHDDGASIVTIRMPLQ